MNTEVETTRRLMQVGRDLLSELDPDVVLERILEEARTLTGARYAALGVLNPERTELARFITLGIDEHERRVIGDLPRGRGVLGVLIDDPKPLRLPAVGSHPQSFGFPAGHPEMSTFLGVPILIRDSAWGNLYLTEKRDGAEFSIADEQAVEVLAQFAATAIENARLYQQAERGRQELARVVRGLDAARTIADLVGTESELDRVLELVVKRGRALVSAQTVLILLVDGDELVVAAGAGTAGNRRGRRQPLEGSVSGRVLAAGRPERIADVAVNLPIAVQHIGVVEAHTALLVPMVHRGNGIGVLIAFDRGAAAEQFSNQDEDLLRTFAASAANAVAISRSVEADRLRITIASAEDERRRWARELHDQTLQGLGGLRVLLSGAGRRDDPEELRAAVAQAISDVDTEIEGLRAIISDLRPALLDDLGLTAALEALIERRRSEGLTVNAELAFPDREHTPESFSLDLETTVYRFVQEALTNVVKHASATSVWITAGLNDTHTTVDIRDNGVGFDPEAPAVGLGLTGIRERVALAGGSVSVDSGEDGTTLHADIPVGH
ncbi:MAG: GAF domain-containing sensor histidine kinase [Solirubrobacterales bacterium]|nr:GAF domain-containing sensor histidine kinase [Solirubrobacterales bacterium]